MQSCAIHLRVISQKMHKLIIFDMSLKITNLKLQPLFPGVNELNMQYYFARYNGSHLLWGQYWQLKWNITVTIKHQVSCHEYHFFQRRQLLDGFATLTAINSEILFHPSILYPNDDLQWRMAWVLKSDPGGEVVLKIFFDRAVWLKCLMGYPWLRKIWLKTFS